MQKHLDQKGSGPLPVHKISGLASFINIRDQCFPPPHHTFGLKRKAHVWKKTKKLQISELVRASTAFHFIVQWTIMFRFFCCHVGIIPHEVQTQLLTATEMFFRSGHQQSDTSWQPEDHLSLGQRAIGGRYFILIKGMRQKSCMYPMSLGVDG